MVQAWKQLPFLCLSFYANPRGWTKPIGEDNLYAVHSFWCPFRSTLTDTPRNDMFSAIQASLSLVNMMQN